VLAALLSTNPMVLGALCVAVALAAVGAGVGRRVARSLYLSVPMAVMIVVINALVARDGLTVLARFGDFGPLGEVDPTLEAVCFGAGAGLQLALIVAICALAAAAVDPDELLRALRRVSFRSALTATLATRMVPLLALDAQRIGEAQRARGAGTHSRTAVMRAITTNALDRALEVAATLEVRGYATARRPHARHEPRSRHDVAFACSAAALVALSIYADAWQIAPFHYYPTMDGAFGAAACAVAFASVVIAAVPFLARSGIER
jgi:energy-coupling factor transport system permease protein